MSVSVRLNGLGLWLTLHIRYALLENLLKNSGVLKLLLDLADDGVCELLLLPNLDLSLISDPRVKDGLGLSGKSSFLFQFVGLGLELSGFLGGLYQRCMS